MVVLMSARAMMPTSRLWRSKTGRQRICYSAIRDNLFHQLVDLPVPHQWGHAVLNLEAGRVSALGAGPAPPV